VVVDLPPPADAASRTRRLSRDLDRYRRLQADIAEIEGEIGDLLAVTDGQILTSLPGVASLRAAAFAAYSLPIDRFPDAEHLYSATGLAPALYQSATLNRRGRISRQGLAEHRDALMSIAWGLSQRSPSFARRDAELRARGMAPIQARSRWPATPADWPTDCCEPNNPSMNGAIVEEGSVAGAYGAHESLPLTATDQPAEPPAQPTFTTTPLIASKAEVLTPDDQRRAPHALTRKRKASR
jgi:hypothetical protein